MMSHVFRRMIFAVVAMASTSLAHARVGEMDGHWTVVTGPYTGNMDINSTGRNFRGRMTFPSIGQDDRISGTEQGNQIVINRAGPWGSQTWVGTLSGFDQVQGTWSGTGGSGTWSAYREARRPMRLVGTWDVVEGRRTQGVLNIIAQRGDSFHGTLSFPALGLRDRIEGTVSRGQVVFERAGAWGSQTWVGDLIGDDQLSGSWSGTGGSGTWSASRFGGRF